MRAMAMVMMEKMAMVMMEKMRDGDDGEDQRR